MAKGPVTGEQIQRDIRIDRAVTWLLTLVVGCGVALAGWTYRDLQGTLRELSKTMGTLSENVKVLQEQVGRQAKIEERQDKIEDRVHEFEKDVYRGQAGGKGGG